MNPRDRCLLSIKHEEVDRVPLVIRIRPEPLETVKKFLNVYDTEKLYTKLGIDIRSTGIGLKGGYEVKNKPRGEAGWVIEVNENEQIEQSIFGYRMIFHRPRTHSYTFIYHPLKHIPLEEYSWPQVRREDFDAVLRTRRKYEDYCLYGGVTHLWEEAWKLLGFSETMVALFKNPVIVKRILDNLHKIRMEQARLLCEARIDVLVDGDDVGMQKSMMLPPKIWRTFLKPYYSELIKLCHRKGVFFLFHSDGWIKPIIKDLIEIGVDILNPVQPEAMDPASLHEEYGDKLCFDGTLSIQRTIPFGTPKDVAEEVISRLKTIGYTGLILGPSHAIQPEAPPENIVAIYETALKYGQKH